MLLDICMDRKWNHPNTHAYEKVNSVFLDVLVQAGVENGNIDR